MAGSFHSGTCQTIPLSFFLRFLNQTVDKQFAQALARIAFGYQNIFKVHAFPLPGAAPDVV